MENKNVKLMLGNNIDRLKELPDNFVDSIVTDPPYGLSFMNKKWDYDVPSVEFWKEVLRVLKPGGHILSFGGTRTYHRMVVNMEDAGFEIRDQIMWVYGSGFPKSLNIGKEADKKLGNKREYLGEDPIKTKKRPKKNEKQWSTYSPTKYDNSITKGNSPYEGWGTGLKPANEPICLARKPIEEKTITENVLKYGTGGINIDGCRVELNGDNTSRKQTDTNVEIYGWSNHKGKIGSMDNKWMEGRFPANFIIDEEASKLLDEQSGESKSNKGVRIIEGNENRINPSGWKETNRKSGDIKGFDDTGGASRFFYVPKVSKKERNMGLDGFEEKVNKFGNQTNGEDLGNKSVNDKFTTQPKKNNHPTVKPINLLTYLCRLITPKGGVILDPYMGSGSTGISALLEGFEFIGMEMDEDYYKIAETRINNYELYKDLIKKK